MKRFLPIAAFLLTLCIIVGLAACGAERPARGSDATGLNDPSVQDRASESVAEASPLGAPAPGAASGYWPSRAAAFGTPFAPVPGLEPVDLGARPQAYGDAAWLDGRGATVITLIAGSPEPRLSPSAAAADGSSAQELVAAAAAWPLPGGLRGLRLAPDGSLSIFSGGVEQARAALPEGLLGGGPYRLYASARSVLAWSAAGDMAAYALPGLQPLWSSDGVVSLPLLTESAALWIRADGAMAYAELETAPSAGAGSLWARPTIHDFAAFGAFEPDPRPAYDGRRVYALDSGAALVAVDAASGREAWRATPGFKPEFIAADGQVVYAFGADAAVSLSAEDGRVLTRQALPAKLSSFPLRAGGLVAYAGADGLVYADGLRSLGGAPEAQAAEHERLVRALRFRLDKYLHDHTAPLVFDTIMPYVEMAPHTGRYAFSVYRYVAPEDAGDMTVEIFGQLGAALAPDGISAIFDDRGEELRGSIDEFGSHPSYTQWFDPGKLYYVAVGRRDPGGEPLFLRIRRTRP
jgi:hypothetical protein